MLPGESEFSRAIAQELDFDLKLGHSLLVLGLSILTERHPAGQPGPNQVVPYRVGHALCIKACKTYRSILLLSQIGASHDTNMLGRTLFETALAVVFVLRQDIQLGINGFPDNRLTSDLRARIYAAHRPIHRYSDFVRHLKDPRFAAVTAQVAQANQDQMRNDAAAAEADIGAFWADRVKRRPRTYSGFTLRELADKLDPDLSHWYAGVYGEQSRPIHAVDASAHVRFDPDENRMVAKWHSSVRDVKSALVPASTLMCRCITEIHNRFQFADNPHEDLTTSIELELAWAMLQRVSDQM